MATSWQPGSPLPFLFFNCFVKAQDLGRTVLTQSLHTALQLERFILNLSQDMQS